IRQRSQSGDTDQIQDLLNQQRALHYRTMSQRSEAENLSDVLNPDLHAQAVIFGTLQARVHLLWGDDSQHIEFARPGIRLKGVPGHPLEIEDLNLPPKIGDPLYAESESPL
ncbi:MAG: hypothetical protein CVV27_02800, partial [Candidatus Melainabacteria bacterium HGW-Melainabacteria-1]